MIYFKTFKFIFGGIGHIDQIMNQGFKIVISDRLKHNEVMDNNKYKEMRVYKQ
jgi:hypothetical protein